MKMLPFGRLVDAVLCMALLYMIGCAPAPRKDESQAVREVITEINRGQESKETTQEAVAPSSKQESKETTQEAVAPSSKKDWKQHVKEDWGDLGHNLVEDLTGLWSREDVVYNAAILGGGGALAVVSRNQWDGSIKKYYDEHYHPMGSWGEVGDILGQTWLHFAIMGTLYAEAKVAEDPTSLEASKRLAEALILNDLTTLALKGAVNRKRPGGGRFSFPSGHASSAFATAAVLDGMYGHFVGVPLYLASSFVAWSRLDRREHYLSDVIFGAALGYVFGSTVTKVHEREVLGFEAAPWVAPDGDGGGVMLQRRF